VKVNWLVVAVAFLIGCAIVVALMLTSRVTDDVRVDTLPARTSWAGPIWPTPDLGPRFPDLADAAAAKKPKPAARTDPSIWDRVAACESGGRWNDTRGGYEGGVHFLNDTWLRAGGRRFAEHAYEATREQQIEIAQSWLERTSWHSQWPVCSRRLGL
jgi:hypothetical protein